MHTPRFVRVIQYLWLFAAVMSLLCEASAIAGVAGELPWLAILFPLVAGVPLSILYVPIVDILAGAGYRLGWFGQWTTTLALGALQWYVIVPLLVRWMRRNRGQSASRNGATSRKPASGRRTP